MKLLHLYVLTKNEIQIKYNRQCYFFALSKWTWLVTWLKKIHSTVMLIKFHYYKGHGFVVMEEDQDVVHEVSVIGFAK
jgi:hypothetical protein